MRLMLGSLLAAGGTGLAARPGVFPGAPTALVTGYTGPSGWAYQVAAASFATTRGAADGVHILTNGGPELVPTDAAPGTAGASRVDIVYVLQPSKGENSDNSSTPVLKVAKGQPSTGEPIAPSLPPGALELARNTITSAATSTASAGNTIQQTWRYTALRGAPILVRSQAERDELNALATPVNPVVVDRLDAGYWERSTGTGWWPVTRDRVDSGTVRCPAAGGGGAAPVYWSDLIPVSFKPGLFTAPPQVFVQTIGPAGQVPMGGLAEQVSVNGCMVRGMRIASTPDALFYASWLAVQVV